MTMRVQVLSITSPTGISAPGFGRLPPNAVIAEVLITGAPAPAVNGVPPKLISALVIEGLRPVPFCPPSPGLWRRVYEVVPTPDSGADHVAAHLGIVCTREGVRPVTVFDLFGG